MNYKKIIKNRNVRFALLRIFSFIPDKWMIKAQYRIKTGRCLNLNNPERYTEKIQWYKLNYKNPVMIQCVDKYEVRKYVADKGLERILNECYGVYEKYEEIDYSRLPDQYVIKDTLGTGGDFVIVCSSQADFDADKYGSLIRKWLSNKTTRSGGREWPYYSGKKHRIIIEKYLSQSDRQSLIEYKFMCFNGKVHFCYVLCDRVLGQSVKEGIFSKGFELLPVCEVGDEVPEHIEKPDNYEEMIQIAETLAADFPHVRVDLYNIDGVIVFGELTFFDSSGYASYAPDHFDYVLGKPFDLKEWIPE